MADGKQSNYFVHTLLRARDWQHRPQFDEVCDWWKSRGRGVCALVGMGGAGKTAIAERFLNVEVQPLGCQDPEKQAEAWTPIKSLPSPHSVFVYSFYDDDKPENFFRDLQIWLEGTSTPDKQKSPMQLMFDIQQHQGLIVLDGLERVQESGARGGFGRLTSPSLRDLLNHIACGAAREMSVLVTSRFPLTDLRDSQPRFFHSIAVDQIDLAAGVSLLRERGVRGTNMQLAPIVEHCGRHALTVDLAGGYIKEYGHGDPSTPLNLGTVEELQAEAEQEPDDDKRDVLIQSKRFARIAQRYREAMLDSDEAALALLERTCLFRLGVDCETLATIFTGPAAERVSNKALANLNAAELQKKLDWLVKMRVVEKGMHPTKNDFYIYSVHPAVRDGFLVGLEVQTVRTSHDAVSRVLSVSLGARPRGKLVIQDNAKLDLVEELIHHTLLAGRTSEAWDIHWCVADELRVWQDFGTFERGLRICRDFLRTCPNDRQMVPGLSAACHAALIHATGICLSQLGRVAESREYFKRFVECGACNHGLSGIYNLAYGFVCTGHLRDAHELMDNGREMVRDSEDPADEGSFVSLLASINGLRGRVEQAVAEFCWSIKQPYTVAQAEDVFHCERLIAFAQIQACLGRRKNALESICRARGEMTSVANQVMLPDCNLLLAEISRESQNHASARALLNECQNWALARESTEVACRIALVEARILINTPDLAERLLTTNTVITRGLKIARDCGYGLYHIDLLLERARLHLLRGDAGAALDDIEVALDTGIPANEETGQVELLSANHEECGYAWAIPVGLQLRAEALLLQAAQGVISVGWAVPTDGSLPPIDLTAMGRAHTTIQQLIDNAEQFLHEALDRWHDLRDPEPTEDNNFVHPETGKEYNYKAEATYKVLVDLEADILTQYPLELFKDKTDQPSVEEELPMTATPSPRVFISYTHDSEGHANNVLQLANRLRNDGIEAHIDQYVQNPSEGWPLWMDNEIEVADFVLVVFTERYAAKAKEAKRSGGRFESVLILQDLYEGGMSNNKFIPVVLCGSDTSFILKWLKSVNRYLVDSDQGYESLRRRLLNDPAIVPPPVGTPVKKGPTNP